MTAPPPKRKAQTCASKRRYPDELTARAGAMHDIHHVGNASELYVYRCPECRGFHLTRRDNGVAARVTGDNPVHDCSATKPARWGQVAAPTTTHSE